MIDLGWNQTHDTLDNVSRRGDRLQPLRHTCRPSCYKYVCNLIH